MSQDPNTNHLFSAFKRPRETMSGFDRNLYGTNLPQPASAMKRPSLGPGVGPGPRMSMAPATTSRMSMAPPRSGGMMRASSGNPMDMGGSQSTVKRNSVRKSFLPSAQPPPSARRSSQYGRPSMGVPGMSGATPSFFTTVKASVQKDPRPLKSPQFKQKMQNDITEYLLENNFEMDMKHALSQNALQSPTQKDFYQIFQWLYTRLDPHYQFTAAKPETEVLPLLTNLRYPYTSTITKTQLTAVGSGNTWPTLLGMLHWMTELSMVTDRYQIGTYDHFAEEEGFSIGADKIVFKYMAKCYNAWLEENDDHEEFEREMVDAFDSRDGVLMEELRALEEENEMRKAELQELDESFQPLKKLQEEKMVLEDDLKKFSHYIDGLETKIKKHADVIKKIKDEIDLSRRELEKSEQEKASLQAKVNAQGLTPQDIDRMNTEREKLNQGIQQVAMKMDEAQQKLDEQEMQAQHKLEELERAVSHYNRLAYQIGITPSTAPQAKGREYELQILPLLQGLEDSASPRGEGGRLLFDNRTGYLPSQILNVDLRHDAKPFLERLRQEIGADIHNTMDESMKASEQVDRLAETLADKKDELETMNAKVQSVNNEYQELKETMQEEVNMSNAEMEKQAANLKQMRVNMNKGLLEAEQKLQSTSIEYDELHQAQAFQRERLHGETQKIVNDVIDFKLHIQKSLEEYEIRAEKACGEDSVVTLH